MALLAGPCLVLVVLAILGSGLLPEGIRPSVMTLTVLALGTPVAWTATWAILTYGFVRPRDLWLDSPALRSSPWLAYGWAPAMALLFGLAAVPASAFPLWALFPVALTIVWWVVVTGEVDRRESKWDWRLRLVLAGGSLTVWWLAGLWGLPEGGPKLRITIAYFTAVAVCGFGHIPLLRMWLRRSLVARRAILVAVSALCLGVSAWILAGNIAPPLQPLAFAAGAVALLAQRVPTEYSQSWSHAFARPFIFILYLAARFFGAGWLGLSLVGLGLLLWGAVNGFVALAKSRGETEA